LKLGKVRSFNESFIHSITDARASARTDEGRAFSRARTSHPMSSSRATPGARPSTSTSSASTRPEWLPKSCGYVARRLDARLACEFYVVGTSHESWSRSARDVREVVRRTNPGCVVVELDGERADALRAEAKKRRRGRAADENLRGAYGDDLLTGLVEAARLDALVVCGDVRARRLGETARRRAAVVVDAARWTRAWAYVRRAAVGDRGNDDDGAFFVNALEAAATVDGGVGAWRAALALVVGASVGAFDGAARDVAVAFDAVSVTAFVCAFCPLVETLWMDRDEELVRNATNAARAAHALAEGGARRVEFRFSADPVVTAEAAHAFTPRDANARPCFTLKRALARGETRRLNLWEPRWLALLDALADANGGRLVGAELGCLLGRTRHYYSVDDDIDDVDDPSRRAASVVVDTAFARARVARVVEGERPLTKARKVEVWIERVDDDDEIVVDVEAHAAGYLLASVAPANERTAVVVDENDASSSVACVVVAGLAHVNGVVAGLAAAP